MWGYHGVDVWRLGGLERHPACTSDECLGTESDE